MKKFHPGHSSAHPRPYNRIPSLAARQVSNFMTMMTMITTKMTTMTMTLMMTMITMMMTMMMMMMIRGRVEEAALILDTASSTNGRKGTSKVLVITLVITILLTIIIIIFMAIIGTPRLD